MRTKYNFVIKIDRNFFKALNYKGWLNNRMSYFRKRV